MADERMDEELKQDTQEQPAEENACDTAAETDADMPDMNSDDAGSQNADCDGKEKKDFSPRKRRKTR